MAMSPPPPRSAKQFLDTILLCTYVATLFPVIIKECGAQIALTYPPARRYDLDFLDSRRTPPPCGMPKGEKRTSLMSGSVFNVTWHLPHSHKGGYKLELLNDEGKPWMDLTPATGDSEYIHVHEETAQSHLVRLPQSLSCTGCTIRLKREAHKLSNNFTFWSCADVDIVTSDKYVENCFGHGKVRDGTCVCDRLFSGARCQYKDECWQDKDCGDHGKCMNIEASSYPKKQCYCQLGWFGDGCKKESAIKSVDLNLKQHNRKELSSDFTLYWRILKQEAQIEVVMQVKTTTYVSIGWRPKGMTSECKAFPPIDDNVASSIEIEGIAEPESEHSANEDDSHSKQEAASSTKITSTVVFTPHSGNATEVRVDEEQLIHGTADAIPYDEAKDLEGRRAKNKSSTTPKPTSESKSSEPNGKVNANDKAEHSDTGNDQHPHDESVAESKGHLVSIGPSPIDATKSEDHAGSSAELAPQEEQDHQRTSSSSSRNAETAQQQDGEVVYGFDEPGQVEYSLNVHTTTETARATSRAKREEPRSATSLDAETARRTQKAKQVEGEATFGLEVDEPGKRFVLGPYTPKLDFNPMDCTDIVTGMVRDGAYSRVRDQYTRDRSTPREDAFWGGSDSLTMAGGFEADGLTTVFFRRPLVAFDDSDHSILKGQMHVIWAKGQEEGSSEYKRATTDRHEPDFYRTDEFKYHGHASQRGVTTIDFLGESKQRKLAVNGHGEFKIPQTCSIDDCEYRATWELVPSTDEILFTVTTNNSDKWTGIGFSSDRKMPDTDAILGWVDDSGRTFIMDTWIDGYSTPSLNETQDVFGFKGTRINGRVTLIFKRKRNTGDTKNDLAFTDTTCLYLVFLHNGGSFNAVNKKIRQHTDTPIVSDSKVCIDGSLSPTRDDKDEVSPNVLAENVAVESAPGNSAPVVPHFPSEGERATVTISSIDGSTPKTLSEYLVAIRLPNQTLGDAVERGIDFEMLIMERLKVYMTDALKRIEGFEKVDVAALESEKNESRVVAKLRVYMDHNVQRKHEHDDDPIGQPTQPFPWAVKTVELRKVLNETIVKGRVGELVVDPSYLVVQPPPELDENDDMSANNLSERGADNATMLLYVVVAAVSALVFLLLVLIICTLCRNRSAQKAKASKDRLIAAGGWKDYAATSGPDNYGYDNFGIAEETPPKSHNKQSMQLSAGSMNGTPRGGSSGGGGGSGSRNQPRANGHTETRSLHRNSKAPPVPSSASNNDRHYTRRSESLPRPMGAGGGPGMSAVDRSRPSSATSLHPQGQLQPDFYFMPSQRRYSGEVVRVYVDYNNPNYTGK